MPDLPEDLTHLLNRAAGGDAKASRQAMPRVYEELRQLARARMAGLGPGQTLQPTALVNEAWVRMAGKPQGSWEGRGHFFFVAARAMRDILVESARRKQAAKRSGQHVDLDEGLLPIAAPADDVLMLDRLLERLADEDPSGHDLVMLRCFAGLSMDEIAGAMGVSKRTAERKWRFLRVWLHAELGEEF